MRRLATGTMSLGLSLLTLPGPARATDEELKVLLKTLSQQVQQLNDRVNHLEQELAQERQVRTRATVSPGLAASSTQGSVGSMAKPSPQEALVANSRPAASGPGWGTTPDKAFKPNTVGDIKGSIKIPGTDTSLAIGGYAKLDAVFSNVGAFGSAYGDQYLMLATIPVKAARLGENSQTTLHAKESRFWFKSYTPSAYGDINTYLEFDLYGAADSYLPRLRHAYGSMGGFLGGQTWTTFLNQSAIPETLDVGSSVGLGNLRQPMIRWSQPFKLFGVPLEFQAAAESPGTRLALREVPALFAPNDDRYPDFIARFKYDSEWGNLTLAGMARQIRYAPSVGPVLAQWGGAASLAGKINTIGLDNIRFSLSFGNVLGRYISLGSFGDASMDAAANTLRLNNTYGAMLSYQHWWDSQWRSTVAYGFVQSNLARFANADLSTQGQSVHVNLLWSPVVYATFGLEYIYATRNVESGIYGDLQRVQFSSRFNF